MARISNAGGNHVSELRAGYQRRNQSHVQPHVDRRDTGIREYKEMNEVNWELICLFPWIVFGIIALPLLLDDLIGWLKELMGRDK